MLFLKEKKIIGILFITLVFLSFIFGSFFIFLKKSDVKNDAYQNRDSSDNKAVNLVSDEAEKVKLEFRKLKRRNWFVLEIFDIPEKTEVIEYEIIYLSEEGESKGVIGSIEGFKQNFYEKEIYLGVCFTRRCNWDDVIGNFEVLLKLKGEYGEKYLNKKFKI